MKNLRTKGSPQGIGILVEKLDDLIPRDYPAIRNKRSDDGSVLDIRRDRFRMAAQDFRGFLDCEKFCHWIRISREIPVSFEISSASIFPKLLLPLK